MPHKKDRPPAIPPASYVLLAVIVVITALILLFIRSREESITPPSESRRLPRPPVVRERPDEDEPDIVGEIAIIIDDFGYNYNGAARGFLELDAALTYAIIPGHSYSRRFAREAGQAGYETIIHMPMESVANLSGEDGYILLTTMTEAEIRRRLDTVFEEYPAAVGMNNHQGSKATQDPRVMTIVAEKLKAAGLYFIDSRTTAKTVAESEMRNAGVSTTRRDVFLDNDLDPALIQQQLDKLADYARKHGRAVGIGHGRRSTLEVLQIAIPKLERQGFRFVHASQVVE